MERESGGNRCLGSWSSLAFVPTLCTTVRGSAHPPPSRKVGTAPVVIPAQQLCPPLVLADSQPQSDLTRWRRRHPSSCPLNGQVACLLKQNSCTPQRPARSQETNTGNYFQGIVKGASSHCLRFVAKSTGHKARWMGKAEAIVLLSKGAHLSSQGRTTPFHSQPRSKPTVSAIKYNHPHTIC